MVHLDTVNKNIQTNKRMSKGQRLKEGWNNFTGKLRSGYHKVREYIKQKITPKMRQIIQKAPGLFNTVKRTLGGISESVSTGTGLVRKVADVVGGDAGNKIRQGADKVDQIHNNVKQKVNEGYKKGEEYYNKGKQIYNMGKNTYEQVRQNMKR